MQRWGRIAADELVTDIAPGSFDGVPVAEQSSFRFNAPATMKMGN